MFDLTALAAALLLAPIVYLLGFAGCTSFGTAEPPTRTIPGPPLEVGPADPPPPPKAYPQIIRETGGLRSHWRLGEGPGATTAFDSATPALDAQYQVLAPGALNQGVTGMLAEVGVPPVEPFDRACEFTGGNGYVEAPYNALRNPPLDFAVELWLSSQVIGVQTTPRFLVSSCQVDPGARLIAGYAMDVAFSPFRIRARIGTKNAANVTQEAQTELELKDPLNGTWWLAVMSFTANKLTLTLRGQTLQTTDVTLPAGFNYVTAAAPTPLRMGAGVAPGTPGAATGYRGKLDEVAVYAAALTPTIIDTHFRAATVKPS